MFKLFGTRTQPQVDAAAQPGPSADSVDGWRTRLRRGLAQTGSGIRTGVAGLFAGSAIDEAFFADLESLLISADVGVRAAQRIIDDLRRAVREKKISSVAGIEAELRASLRAIVRALERPLSVGTAKPFVILLAGVNGSGKTTTIGKLAQYFKTQGKSVMLAAGDTFRAAAREQLLAWGERNDVSVIAQEGGDSAAVIFDAIRSAQARGIDVVLADTAGRLPTQLHLMEEIRKVKRVIAKADDSAPHETLLVIDANTGQNALAQIDAFDRALQLSGLVVTKLDGTAKGGVIAALACERADRVIPVRFIGVGEGRDDLRPFVADEFVDALFQ